MRPFKGNWRLHERIRQIIEDTIVYGRRAFTKGAFDDDRDWDLTLYAQDRIRMYRLVADGIASYEQLGVPMFRGAYPDFILREHLIIRGMILAADEEKARLKKIKALP